MNNETQDIYDGGRLYTNESPIAGIIPESLLQTIWRNRWILFLSVIFSLVIAFIYVTQATPIFQSTSSIYVEQSGPRIITEMEQGVMTQSKNYLYTQAGLLKSTPIIAAAVDSSGIKQMKTFARVDNIVAFIKREIDVGVGRKDDIIRVSFNSPYPAEAAQIVNEVVDSYITYHATQKQSTSADVLKIIQKEKAIRSKELSEKLQALKDFSNENVELVFEGEQGNLVLDRLARYSTVLTEAQLMTLERKSIYEDIKKMLSSPIGIKRLIETQMTTGTSSSIYPERAELKSRLDDLELRRNNLLRQLTPDHPGCLAYENDIENLKAQIDALDTEFAQAQLAVAEQRYLTAKTKEDEINRYYNEQFLQAVALNEQLTQYTLLQSDYEQTKELCDILDNRIKDLNITEDTGALNIHILEVAHPAETPSEPQKARYMAIALVLGCMIGLGLTLLRDWMDQKLHSAEEISNVIGVPILGVVPSMSKRESISERGRKIQLETKSSWAEAYRTIRTAIFFSAPKSEARTILVTSPAPADGKSTLVSNLAISMAQAGQKILILDADFRKPMQHNIFGINHEDVGLSSVLAETISLEEAIQTTQVNGLDLLSRGPDVPNPSEILNSNKFAELLKLLARKYDRIIIDSPPVTPVTDAQILSAICDITLLVLRAEKSTRKTSQQARHGLLSVGAHLLGVVVNDVPNKRRYGYYSSYGQYYGYYGSNQPIKKKADVLETADTV